MFAACWDGHANVVDVLLATNGIDVNLPAAVSRALHV